MSPLTEPTRLTLAKGQPVPNDPYFAFNSLLLHGNGSNGSTVITDSSGSPKTVTAFGNAQISTAQSKFGGSSIAFDGSGDYLTIPSSADWTLGSTGDFTIELWSYANGNQGNAAFVVGTLDDYNSSFLNRWALMYSTGTTLTWLGSNGNALITVTVTPSAWSHIAAVRSGSLVSVYLNGTLAGSNSSNQAFTTQASLKVGFVPGAAAFNGYIDDLRITKGVARYTSNFTPPTAPFPDF